MLTVDPGAWPIIEGINNFIMEGDLYKALKEAKKLIAHEKELLDLAANDLARKTA
jgi:flagellar protein FlbT